MDDTKQNNHGIISHSLRLIKQCPVCNTSYTSRKVQIVDFTETGVLLYFSCPICQSSLLAQIVEMPFGMVGSAMLTDLKFNEVQKFKNAQPVNADDVLEVYQKLESRD